MKGKYCYNEVFIRNYCYAFGYECVFIAHFHNKTDEFKLLIISAFKFCNPVKCHCYCNQGMK